jgi:two-component system sensor kinase FixL
VARRHLSAIIDGSGDAIFGSTADALVTSWNAAAEALFGYTAEEIIGQPLSTLAPEGCGSRSRRACGAAERGGPAERFESTRRRKDGSLVDVVITASRATDEAGEAVGLSVIAHDITESRVAQRALDSQPARAGRGAADRSARQLRVRCRDG